MPTYDSTELSHYYNLVNLQLKTHEFQSLKSIEVYTYLIIGSMSTITSLLFLISHIRIKQLRQQPGDLILMISLAELILTVHWITSAIFTQQISGNEDLNYKEKSRFCLIQSLFAVPSAILEVTYNLNFLLYILFKLNSSVEKKFVPTWHFHIFSILVSALVLLY
jgi:hypothetical protein